MDCLCTIDCILLSNITLKKYILKNAISISIKFGHISLPVFVYHFSLYATRIRPVKSYVIRLIVGIKNTSYKIRSSITVNNRNTCLLTLLINCATCTRINRIDNNYVILTLCKSRCNCICLRRLIRLSVKRFNCHIMLCTIALECLSNIGCERI